MSQNNISTRVKTFRDNLGWSQAELAEKSGISRKHLNQIENEKAQASSETINKLATALGCRVTDLTGGEITIPASLEDFAQSEGLSAADALALARIEFRGRRPSTPNDWMELWNVVKRLKD